MTGVHKTLMIHLGRVWLFTVCIPVYSIIVIVTFRINRLLQRLTMSAQSKRMHREIMKVGCCESTFNESFHSRVY